jgi:hypothetical protein
LQTQHVRPAEVVDDDPRIKLVLRNLSMDKQGNILGRLELACRSEGRCVLIRPPSHCRDTEVLLDKESMRLLGTELSGVPGELLPRPVRSEDAVLGSGANVGIRDRMAFLVGPVRIEHAAEHAAYIYECHSTYRTELILVERAAMERVGGLLRQRSADSMWIEVTVYYEYLVECEPVHGGHAEAIRQGTWRGRAATLRVSLPLTWQKGPGVSSGSQPAEQ